MDLDALYRYRFSGIDQDSRNVVWREVTRFILAAAGSPKRILDPACGIGEFINSCNGEERWAMDLGLDGSTLESDIKFFRMSFLESGGVIPEKHFDLVFASNVLEHMSDIEAVHKFLMRAREVLTPGGCIVIMGPNFRYCMKEYFDCADHVIPLTHVSIEEHLVTAGFELKRTIPRFLPYSFRSRLPASRMATRAYLKLPLAWRIFGKQFLVIGVRPAAS